MGELFLFVAGIVAGVILVKMYEGFFVKKEIKVTKGKDMFLPDSNLGKDSKDEDIFREKPL